VLAKYITEITRQNYARMEQAAKSKVLARQVAAEAALVHAEHVKQEAEVLQRETRMRLIKVIWLLIVFVAYGLMLLYYINARI
jgi:hypothetical protein